VVGGSPGVAYNQTPGYLVGPMFGPYGENDFEGAAEIVRGVLQEHPGLPIGLYNLACCEARLGETDSSLEHLEQAIAGDPGFASLARDDGDFESLRENARFKELVG
jgi:hypothetical protein